MKKLLTILLILGMISLVSAVGITYYFLTHISGTVHNSLVFSNTGNQNLGTIWTNTWANTNNLSVQVNANQIFNCFVTYPSFADNVTINGLNISSVSNDTNKYYFTINQPTGTYNFYASYFINKYANDSQALLSDVECY